MLRVHLNYTYNSQKFIDRKAKWDHYDHLA